MDKRINVTQEDIDQGLRHSWTECPIARAVKRTGQYDMVFVGGGQVMAREAGVEPGLGAYKQIARLPAEATSFIWAYDTGRAEVKPFEFKPLPPDPRWDLSDAAKESIIADEAPDLLQCEKEK